MRASIEAQEIDDAANSSSATQARCSLPVAYSDSRRSGHSAGRHQPSQSGDAFTQHR
jgi:hypothetical protein